MRLPLAPRTRYLHAGCASTVRLVATAVPLCTGSIWFSSGIACSQTCAIIEFIRSRHLHKLQRRHFIIFDILPFVGTLVALGLLFYRPIGAVDISLFFAMWLLTGFGLTVGYHRLFTHRAFSTGTGVSCALIILGSMAGRGSMLSWVAMHRRHHELSDHEGDLHSPNLHGTTMLGRLTRFSACASDLDDRA